MTTTPIETPGVIDNNERKGADGSSPSGSGKVMNRRALVGTLALVAVGAAACRDGENAEGVGGATGNLAIPDPADISPEPLPLFEESSNRDDDGSVPTTRVTRPSPTSTTSGRPTTTRRTATTERRTTTTLAVATTAPAMTSSTTAAPTTTSTTAAPTTTTTEPPPVVSTSLLATRVTFGSTPGVENDLSLLGASPWIEQQLSRSAPDPTVEALVSGFRTLDVDRQQAYQIRKDADDDVIRYELTHSALVRSTYSTHQLYEMMCHLWMDHFNLNISGNSSYRHLAIDYQENVIRPNAMGRFSDLLMATANSSAMMIYLDNYRSNASSSSGVNENYGRELLELHSLGIDRNDNQIYTEEDVVGAALIMSGWSVDTDRNSSTYSDFLYRSNYHHTEPVSILGGAFSSAGLSGKAAGDALVDYLATHPTTARHIAWKLARRFVSDTPSEALIASTAQVYLANDTQLIPTLRHLLNSTEMAQSDGLKFRRPFELLIASMRGLGTSLSVDPTSRAARVLRDRLNSLGQEPWRWEQPDGYADFSDPWIHSDGMLRRWELSARLARDNMTSSSDAEQLLTDLNALRGSATTAGELYDEMAMRFGLGVLPANLREQQLALVDAADADAANSIDDDALAELASYLLAHPIFQLR